MSQQPDLSSVKIESSVPRVWEEDRSFNDVLYEWMRSAPWLAISLTAHLLIFFIMSAIPWEKFSSKETRVLTASAEVIKEEIVEEPPPEPEEEIEEEPLEEPVLKDAEVAEKNETDNDQPFESSEGDPDFISDAPFKGDSFNDVIGIGGGAGGKFGGRFGGNRNTKAGGKAVEAALTAGLEWLKNHQSPDGSWDCDGFNANCGKIGSTVCGDPGRPQHDVGVTGLALLAFLGEGNTTEIGKYKDVVARGIKWLRDQQDPDTGLLGDDASHEFLYNHAIGTLAICEAYYFSKSPTLKRTAQEAVEYIQRARNPYGAWRYDVPPTGANDTSVTGWMVFALTSAKEAGLKVDPGAFEGAMSWLDEVTDPATGRTGYDSFGSLSSRVPGVNDQFPADRGESMTAVALLCRVFMGQKPGKDDNGIMEKNADVLKKRLPEWDAGVSTDVYYWYYGTYAMFQMGGSSWSTWEKSMKKAILDTQEQQGDEKGSWPAAGDAWGFAGGRVYTTALLTLSLEVYFRYGQVLGSR